VTPEILPKQLTDSEKVAAFDRIADACAVYLDELQNDPREDSDAEAAIEETALEEVYGEGIFEIIERLSEEYSEEPEET
jgi:hypothetical protein